MKAAQVSKPGGDWELVGVTVFNALRHTDSRAGDVVAVHGIGGLGQLGVQCASRA